MQITHLLVKALRDEGKRLRLLDSKDIEDYSFDELVAIHPDALAAIASLIGARFVSTVAELDQGYAPNLAPLSGESDFQYDKRLNDYIEKRYFPATEQKRNERIGAIKCTICFNPFIPEMDGMSDEPLVLAPSDVISAALSGVRGQGGGIAPYFEEESILTWIWRLVSFGYRQGAADIEMTSHQSSVKIRMHIMGEWTNWVGSLPLIQRSGMLRALCACASPPIDYEAGTVHDFKVERRIDGVETSWRVSITPAALGDSVCLRSLPQIGRVPALAELGYSDQAQRLFKKACRQIDGLVLITGPTGSGKSTTLYSLMTMLNNEGRKVVSVENPVELVIPGTVQIQVLDDESMDEKYKITFGSVIRTALRHKPDDLVIGETRDRETAQAAVGASHTGHLTFSTLHTTNIQTSIKRMIDLGIDAVNLSDVLTLVVSQTLLPMLCPHCSVQCSGGGAERSQTGCSQCNNRGIVGKVVVYEMCYFDDEARRAVVEYKMQEQFTRLELSGLYIKKEDVLRQLVAEGRIDRRYLEDMG